jgi:hypothetical protein
MVGQMILLFLGAGTKKGKAVCQLAEMGLQAVLKLE